MSDPILDALAAGDLLAIGSAPSAAMAMTYAVNADSIGLAMQNAVQHQQRMQTVAGAALSVVLTRILAAPSKG